MKKVLAIAASLVLAGTLFGCGGQNTVEVETQPEESSTSSIEVNQEIVDFLDNQTIANALKVSEYLSRQIDYVDTSNVTGSQECRDFITSNYKELQMMNKNVPDSCRSFYSSLCEMCKSAYSATEYMNEAVKDQASNDMKGASENLNKSVQYVNETNDFSASVIEKYNDLLSEAYK